MAYGRFRLTTLHKPFRNTRVGGFSFVFRKMSSSNGSLCKSLALV